MLEETTHCENKLVEPAKATSPAKIDVGLRILIVVMLDKGGNLLRTGPCQRSIFAFSRTIRRDACCCRNGNASC